MRRLLLVAAVAALSLSGCAASDFTKEGASEQEFVRDEQLCRAQVNRMAAHQRVVDDSRRDTFRTDQARTGQSALPEAMASQGDIARKSRLMESCMTARGWTPKAPWWQRLAT
jgi:hypothetical protein